MTEASPSSETKARPTVLWMLLWVWAISATFLGLTSTVLLLFLYLSTQRHHDGWTRWKVAEGGNGHWYKVVVLPKDVTWSEADRLARLEGGYLATITSAAENSFVFALINAPQFFTDEHGAGPALGGLQQDRASEPDGGWSWVSGEPWDYSNWLPGEPNNGRSRTGDEDRVHYYSGISRTPAATWNDVNRSDPNQVYSYVVERNK
jgi:hypothetical protein